ncbi:type I toxin-antitoxin system Ibs family toxin, partial [Escherichia coli]|nr:type I toxin-antitoxin system Ibs family toxin [Escherichia coli]MCN5047423.1 type I toxin-antitoxin system Ibs family toxin [Escherichia coli]MCN5170697.1 type I toxin-antitoxin system Ibs family toxin [Escherichia coli]MCN5700220.1 type I toxin-antitoxin system Ibs family toxin [Escherichia coli]MCN6477654.1 type I toxin-antitoxin system Ibs family toxin [Escherichia coli]
LVIILIVLLLVSFATY